MLYCVQLYPLADTPQLPPSPHRLGSYTRALFASLVRGRAVLCRDAAKYSTVYMALRLPDCQELTTLVERHRESRLTLQLPFFEETLTNAVVST